MDIKLFFQALMKVIIGAAIVGALVFVPAGALSYWQGWLLMAVLFIPMFVAGLIMMIKNPELLRKRLNADEEQDEQKAVVLMSIAMFVASFVIAGLNYRFAWIQLPDAVSYVFAVVFLLGYVLYAEVLKENTYLSRTVEVQEDQKVVDTGLYGIVRHPMYMATLVLFLSMPLVLGSILSFAVMLLYIPIINKRMNNEEKVLSEGLPGYKEYMNKVRSRVIPHIW
jgi:protein-S-isoprenylcysteine O-methyltransferase Ste14